jgi:putative toxin-antitoxin system antitoxin component (TIGR02293 family)
MPTSKRRITSKSKQLTRTRIPGTRTLGLRSRRKEELVRKVRSGFAYSQLSNLEKATGFTRERIAAFVAIPQRTLARRQSEGRLNPEESDRVLRASRVFEMAVDLFEDDVDEARRWLQTPNPALAGDSPIQFASTDVGAREVENLIGRLEHGVFA